MSEEINIRSKPEVKRPKKIKDIIDGNPFNDALRQFSIIVLDKEKFTSDVAVSRYLDLYKKHLEGV